MSHWLETYPHNIYASVLLLNNEIYNYKIGQRYWEHPSDMTWKLPLPDNFDAFTIQVNKWTVHTPEEHNEVFHQHAKEWMRQWRVHKDYVGSKPY